MYRIPLVDSGSCARASVSLQMHRGYLYYPRYFDSKLAHNYVPIVILRINTERILGSGSYKTSCTKLKKVIFFTRTTPVRSKLPNIVPRDMQIQTALRSSFGPKLIWAATGAPRRPNSEILPRHTVDLRILNSVDVGHNTSIINNDARPSAAMYTRRGLAAADRV